MDVNLHLTEGFLSNLKMTFSFLSFPKKHICVFHHNLRKYVRITLLQFFSNFEDNHKFLTLGLKTTFKAC